VVTLVSYAPKNNKVVILLSTQHDSKEVAGEKQKPQIVLDYNETKAGVDIADQMIGSCSSQRGTRR